MRLRGQPKGNGGERRVGPRNRGASRTFWLINGMLVEMPLRAIPGVAARQDVLSLEPNNTGEGPPQVRAIPRVAARQEMITMWMTVRPVILASVLFSPMLMP